MSDNLVVNGDAEMGNMFGWNISSEWIISYDRQPYAHSGRYSFLTHNKMPISISQNLNLNVGETYEFSLWALDFDSFSSLSLSVGNNTLIDNIALIQENNGYVRYTLYSYNFVAIKEVEILQIKVSTNTNDPCHQDCGLLIDDISVTFLSSPNPTISPSWQPSIEPTLIPSIYPSFIPTSSPSSIPTVVPSTYTPSMEPSLTITHMPVKQENIIETKVSVGNSKINNHQTACLINDLALTVWQGSDKDESRIYARTFNLNGGKGGVFQVDNKINNGDQTNPVSVQISNTSCLVAWINNKVGISGAIIDLINNKVGDLFHIKKNIQPCGSGTISLSATGFNNEGYVLSWSETKDQYCSTVTKLVYNNGTQIFLANDRVYLSNFYNSHLTSFGEIIVVTDIESRYGSSNSNVHARVYNGNLGLIGSNSIDIFDISNEGIPISGSQRFLARSTIYENIITFMWENKNAIGNWQLYKKEYTINGDPVSLEFKVTIENNNINPSMISFKNEAKVLTCFSWHQYNSHDDISIGIYLQCLDEQNNAQFKQPLKINHQFTNDLFSTNNYDSSYMVYNERVGFIAFFSEFSSNNNRDIYLQKFDKNGQKVPCSEDILMKASSPEYADESNSYSSILICSELLIAGLTLTGAACAAYNYYYHGSKGGLYTQLVDLEMNDI